MANKSEPANTVELRTLVMKVARYIFGVLGCFLTWMCVSVAVRVLIDAVLGQESAAGSPWRFVPGGVLGWWLGSQVFRLVVQAPLKKNAR